MNILGIDIGGTGIKGAIVDTKNGTLVTERYRISTPKPATPEAVAKSIKKMVTHFKWDGPVGCGFPTPLKHGTCQTGGNLHPDWKGTHVDTLFKKTTGNTFYIVNDADAAGLSEINYGAGKGVKGTVVVITVGTGIGSGLFLDGNLIPNTEFGHVLYKNGDIFEKYASDTARKKEGLSKKAWSKRLNKYFKHISLVISPDLIIIGGGASKKFEKLEAKIDLDVPLVPAKAENEAGIIGAALAAKYKIA